MCLYDYIYVLTHFSEMGSCLSGQDHVEVTEHPDSPPAPSTSTGPVIPQTQPIVPPPNTLDSDPVGVTPEHIADREGGCGYLNKICYVVDICNCHRPVKYGWDPIP